MRVRFWGTRGSIAAPGDKTARYGGNTSCVEVRADDGTLIVLDCGTGARELGMTLARVGGPLRLHLFIGHTHWDHIQGFPFFVPAFRPDVELNVYSPLGFQASLEDAMAGQMEYAYFPVKLSELRSRIHFTELEEGFFRVGDVLVETQYLNHTAPTIGYRLTSQGATVAYVTDHEPFWKPVDGLVQHPGDQRHTAFLRGVDLLIHDAQYTDTEYALRVGWGHSPVDYVTDIAIAAGVDRLALFHHDPTHDDDAMASLEAAARQRVRASGAALDVFAAREGLELAVAASGRAVPVAEVSALRRRLVQGARVLVVSHDAAAVAGVGAVVAEDGMVTLSVPDMRAAMTRGAEHAPDLVVLDAALPAGDGIDLVHALRTRLARPGLPVIVLAERPDEPTLRRGGPEATDLLAKPYSPPMLRARIRAWLARTLAGTPDTIGYGGVSGVIPPPADLAPNRALLANMLGTVPLFRSVTPDDLRYLAAEATEQVYAGGHVIVRQGEAPDRLWVLLSGRVRVIETTADGRADMLLGELGRMEVFGELGVLRDQPRSATVIAVERAHCLVLRQRDFVKVLERSAELANALVRLVAGRLYDADRKLARLSPDSLTGLPSRRAFNEQYARIAATARRRKTGLLLLTLDVRDLKAINDAFGYALGDEVLRTVADALTEATRTTDVTARYGGDEFAALLLDAQPRDVDIVVGRVQDKLGALARQRRLPVTIHCSVGMAWSVEPPLVADEFLRDADRDMQARKRAERERRADPGATGA